MEEDEEIQSLLKEHGSALMEAAETAEYYYKASDKNIIELTGDKKQAGSVEADNCILHGDQQSGTRSGESSNELSDSFEKSPEAKRRHKPKIVRSKQRNKGITSALTRGEENSHRVRDTEESCNEIDGEDVQNLLDCHIYYENTRKRINQRDTFVDENSEDSESVNCESNSDCEVINEIMANNEPRYTKGLEEHLRNDIKKNSEILNCNNKTLHELNNVNKLIIARDRSLRNLSEKLQNEIRECEEKQMVIRDKLYSFSDAKFSEPSFSRTFFKKFGIPYFEDSQGFTPPPNEDTRRKIENGELLTSSMFKMKYWTESQKEALEKAIGTTIVDEHKGRLTRKILRLKENLEKITEKDKVGELVIRVTKYQEELETVKTLSLSELLAKEDPNREYDWMKYSASVFNNAHSAEECRKLWHLYLKPSINRSGWKSGEDCKLLEIVGKKMNFQNWDAIAQLLGTNRTAHQCYIHYHTRIHKSPDFSFGRWTKEEDEKLLSVVKNLKIGDFVPWAKVSSHFADRSHSQIYTRYMNCLNPNLVKGRFTRDEDLLIVSGIEVFGVSYREMASLLNNRSANQVRERYERFLLPRTAKVGTWSLQEDEQLVRLVEEFGEKNWVAVSKAMKTRTRTQVRQRYQFIQKMMKTKPGWTPAKVKRRNLNQVDKILAKVYKQVEGFKKEMEMVEKTFQLSKVESDTFKIEKLVELRDTLILKQVGLKKKKKEMLSASEKPLEFYPQLIDYFKPSALKIRKDPGCKEHSAYLHEIMVLAKYFGHDLKFPEFEDEILENPRLSKEVKTLLVQRPKPNQITHSANAVKESNATPSSEPETNIDYQPSESDNTLFMMEWWYNPPTSIHSLNFSEFFKRTVFDYSYGMHKDIWESKKKRPKKINFSSMDDQTKLQPPHRQPLFIPPNQCTTTGLKTMLLTHRRMKKLASNSADPSFYETLNSEEPSFKGDPDLRYELLDKFQETLLSLFTWPKVLSLDSIKDMIPVSSESSTLVPKRFISSKRNLVNVLESSDKKISEIYKTTSTRPDTRKLQNRKIIMQKIFQQNQDLQRKLSEHKKGLRYKRKIKIEHLIASKKGKVTATSLKSQEMKGVLQKKNSNNSNQENSNEQPFKCKQTTKIGWPSFKPETITVGSLKKTAKEDENIKPSVDNDFCNDFTVQCPAKTYLRSKAGLSKPLKKAKNLTN